MIELQHRATPTELLSEFVTANPQLTPADFSSHAFQPVKLQVKADLNADQGGLCAYCEKPLGPNEGQIDHIKPKDGPHGHPHLCFSYSNYAHSCINPKTCGQQKKSGLLPIEPQPGCNTEWILSTDGTIMPIAGLSRQRRHAVVQTRDMLGLHKDANLVDERKRWLASVLAIGQAQPQDMLLFLQTAPYRHILATVLL